MITFLKEHWSIITNVGSVMAALVVVLLATKFPRREELEIVIKDVSKLKKDVVAIQNKVESLPTKEDIHKLNLEISGLRGDIKEIKPELSGVKRISDLLLEHELKEKHK